MSEEFEFVDHSETEVGADVLERIRDWLQPTDYLAESGEFRRHLSTQAPGTGLWICETEEYAKWHDSDDHGSLWIKGIPGAGKSVMAASLIQHLQATEQCPVLFFFFRNIVTANFTPRALIQDWLAQLLPHSPKLQFILQARLDTNLSEISDFDLFGFFRDGLACVPKAYCVADALDEMPADNRQFLDRLSSLATYRPASLKLLMTSRPKRHLQSALRDSSIVHISLQQRLVDVDILAYLRYRIATIIPDEKEHLRQTIVDMVATRSEGLFLYAKLTVDQLEAVLTSVDSDIDVPALAASLPVGLEQTYNVMLAKHRRESGASLDIQLSVLEAIIYAARPLRLNELASLMACVSPEFHVPGGWKALISSCCGSLVEVLEDETLQVIHHSFTEFLRDDKRGTQHPAGFPVIHPDTAHKRMATNCLRYMGSGTLLLKGRDDEISIGKGTENFGDREYQKVRLQHSFLGYAVQKWTYHASQYDKVDEDFFAAITAFHDADSVTFHRWLAVQWASESGRNLSDRCLEGIEVIPTELHLAAFAGLSELTRLLLTSQTTCIDSPDGLSRTPLHWAAANGHAKVVSVLLQRRAEPNLPDQLGVKPIHLAARKNHAEVVKLLLEAGVEPNTAKTKEDHPGPLRGGEKSTIGDSAILYAARNGHTETILTMAPFCDEEALEQLLCQACEFGRADAVSAILETTSVSADAAYCGATALHFACRAANAQCVEALIQRGADVSKTSILRPRTRRGHYLSPQPFTAPIHCLTKHWDDDHAETYRRIFDLLVSAGVNLEQLNGSGKTALMIAVKGIDARPETRLGALRALIDAGVNINLTDAHGNAPLHHVCRVRNPEAMKILLNRGSDANEKGNRGVTPLLCALNERGRWTSDMGHHDLVKTCVQILLRHGADPNTPDNDGRTPLMASMSWRTDIFNLLLGLCHDIAVKIACWFELAEAKLDAFPELVELLLAEGIDINTRGPNKGRTLYAECFPCNEKLQILEGYGADTEAMDGDGYTARQLQFWADILSREYLEPIIASGVEPYSRDKDGNTIIHRFAANGQRHQKLTDCVVWLAGLGVPMDAKNNAGRTPLHVHLIARGSFQPGSFNDVFLNAGGLSPDIFRIRDVDGLAPLHLAAMRSEPDTARLVEAGADLTFLTSSSQNVLHLACQSRKPGIAALILGHYPGIVNVNAKDKFGMAPLHYACVSGEPESVALLLDHGADVHSVTLEGSTPLHACARSASEQTIWQALHQPSTPWMQPPIPDPVRLCSPQGVIPGELREPWYQLPYNEVVSDTPRTSFPAVGAIARLLLNAKADAGARDRDRCTPLDVALRAGTTDFVEVFAQSKELLVAATDGLGSEAQVKQMRLRIKTNMLLMRHGSHLDYLRADPDAFEEALQSPNKYLNILKAEDVAELIDKGFRSDVSRPAYYKVLKRILTPINLSIVELTRNLTLRYSSFEAARDYIDRARLDGDHYHENPAHTALGIACAASESNMLALQLLVERFQVDVNAHSASLEDVIYTKNNNPSIRPGGTALHVLAEANHYWQIQGLKYLLDHGADVDALDEKGRSPLHIAAWGLSRGSWDYRGFWALEAVGVLLDHGANPRLIDLDDQTPLHKASAAPRIMRELLRRGADPTAGAPSPIFSTILDQNLEALETLLDNGVSPDALDDTSNSSSLHDSLTAPTAPLKKHALLCTAYAEKINNRVTESLPLLQALMTRGANLYLPLSNTDTLIHFLFEYPEFYVANTLLEEPCVSLIDFSRRDQRNRTILMAACEYRDILPGYYSYQFSLPKEPAPPLRILDLGADATCVDSNGRTALHLILDNSGMPDEVVMQFINRPEVAPVLFTRDNNGFTPFDYSLRLLRPKVVELFLEKGANLLDVDPDGGTALHHIATQIFRTELQPRNGGLANSLSKKYPRQCITLWDKSIAMGGDINACDNEGNTPLHAYCLSPEGLNVGRRHDQESDDEEEQEEEKSQLCHLAMFGKLFPEGCGVDLFAVNKEGETMLHVIARREDSHRGEEHDEKMFLGMVGRGLDPLREDARGRSALDVASAVGKDGIVELFRRK
ncbi:hypothetical protein OQA88_635 [Cercophora sp. LCS_1]